jgi:CubicO group peptidase (beta-lactamase class C family)
VRRVTSRQLLALLGAALAIAAFLLAPRVWRGYGRAPNREAVLLARYEPRELLAGDAQPPAPRVAPELEQLELSGLEAAAAYASEHGSQALIVSRHDHIVFERYWQGTSFDTLSDAQSLTPLLAALAAGVAVSHRRIAWPDEPVGAFLSEWREDPRGAITVRNLMQMSSGLKPVVRGAPANDLLSALLSTPLAVTPGATRSEQAADPQLLALVIERATGQRYASYLSQAVWRRIGAADAWLWLDRPGGMPHADCCLLARQGDWIRVGQLLVRDGNYRGEEVMRPGWVSLMRMPAKADPAYGAFVRIAAPTSPGQESYAARDVFVAGGESANRLWLVPSLQLAILCTSALAQRDAQWNDGRIPNLIIRAARDAPPNSARPGGTMSSVVPGH